MTPRAAQSACIVEGVSRIGASVLMTDTSHLTVGMEVTLAIEGHGEVVATVRHIIDRKVGLEFTEELTGELPP